jgi:ubiquinone biosynthesis protein
MLDPALNPSRLVTPEERASWAAAMVDIPEHGTAWIVFRLTGWLLGVLWLRVTRRVTLDASASRLRHLLEEFGGLWIKAGQLLSLRVDLFSAGLCRELSSLQTRGRVTPFDDIRAILETDLGQLESVFEHFDERPFATTWIAQIHRARLRHEGVWVAVKVQRPGVARAFARDLRIVRAAVRLLVWLNVYESVGWKRGVQELEEVAREESDLRFEAAAISRMKDILPRRKIVVPDLFPSYCTPRVLVTEFIHAALMSDFIKLRAADPGRLAVWLSENHIEPTLLARRLINSFLRQLFEDNFYHGDLYPGNIVLLRDSGVALLQFGACSFTEREYLIKVRLFFRALATRDYAKAADLALLLCGQLPAIDTEEVKEELVRGLRTWASRTFVKGLPYHEKSIDQATIVVTRVLFKHGCPMDWAFLRIRRALTILDASLVHLDPDINYTELVSSYFRKAERRTLQREIGKPLAIRAAGSVVKALDMQDRLAEYSLFQGAIIRRHAQVFQGATDKLSEFVAALLGQVGVLLAVLATFLLLAAIEQRSPGTLSPVIGGQISALLQRVPAFGMRVWAIVFGLTWYAWWTTRRLRRRFREKDIRLQRPGPANV